MKVGILDFKPTHETMNCKESAKKQSDEHIVVVDKAQKLAESWAEKMFVGMDDAEDNILEPEIQNRPSRLGLGAKFLPHSQFMTVLSPVEKKLQAKFNSPKHETKEVKETFFNSKGSKRSESNVHHANDDHEESDSDELDSRSSVFHKKEVKNRSSLETQRKSKKRRK